MIQEKVINATSSGAEAREILIGVIPDVIRTRLWLGKDQFNVVATTKRMLFIPLQPLPGGYKTLERYVGRPTEEILAENKKSISIEKSEIKSVQYQEGHSYVDCCRKVQELEGELEIHTSRGKYTFSIPFRRNITAKDVLEKAKLPSLEIIKPNTESEASHSETGGSCCSH